MGPAFIGASNSTGNVVSGTAMRYKMISPLEKARRIQNDLTEPLREVISSILSIEKLNIPAIELDIVWKDPLPKDPREIAELTRVETGSAAVKPLLHSIMDNYGIDKETAEHYIEEIYKQMEIMKKFNGTNYNNDQNNLKPDGRSEDKNLSDLRAKGSNNDPASDTNKKVE